MKKTNKVLRYEDSTGNKIRIDLYHDRIKAAYTERGKKQLTGVLTIPGKNGG